MKGLRLYKKEKLCSLTAIGQLFARPAGRRHPADQDAGREPSCRPASAITYPWRAVWQVNTHRHADCAQFLISVPKRKLRHAVDRVLMRRRCREAYRLQRSLLPSGVRVDIAFTYVADHITEYGRTERAIARLLQTIAQNVSTDGGQESRQA